MQVTEHPKDVDFSGPEVNNDDEVFSAGGGQLAFADYDDDGEVADVGGEEEAAILAESFAETNP